MNSDSSATPPIGEAGERSAPYEWHYQSAVDTLRQLEAKPVSAVLGPLSLGRRPVMTAAGILVIHRIDDDGAHFIVGDGVLMSVWREPAPVLYGFASDGLSL